MKYNRRVGSIAQLAIHKPQTAIHIQTNEFSYKECTQNNCNPAKTITSNANKRNKILSQFVGSSSKVKCSDKLPFKSKSNNLQTTRHSTATRCLPVMGITCPSAKNKKTQCNQKKAIHSIYVFNSCSSKTILSTECTTPILKPNLAVYNSCTAKDKKVLATLTSTEYKTTNGTESKQELEWKKCKCSKEKGAPMCNRVKSWFQMASKQKAGLGFSVEQMKSKYYNILYTDTQLDEEVDLQIKRDLHRTFPNHKSFNSSGGVDELYRVLKAYAIYSHDIGYVQGMNFICGTLLYHCQEEIAFWLFVILMEDYELQDVYMVGLPGLYKHTQMISMLLSMNYDMKEIFSKLVS